MAMTYAAARGLSRELSPYGWRECWAWCRCGPGFAREDTASLDAVERLAAGAMMQVDGSELDRFGLDAIEVDRFACPAWSNREGWEPSVEVRPPLRLAHC